MEWNIALVPHNTVLWGLHTDLTLTSSRNLYFGGDNGTYIKKKNIDVKKCI